MEYSGKGMCVCVCVCVCVGGGVIPPIRLVFRDVFSALKIKYCDAKSKQTRFNKQWYLMRQDNTINTFSIIFKFMRNSFSFKMTLKLMFNLKQYIGVILEN